MQGQDGVDGRRREMLHCLLFSIPDLAQLINAAFTAAI
jgi:hypothetical protein